MNNEIRELSRDELDLVSGGGIITDAMDYAVARASSGSARTFRTSFPTSSTTLPGAAITTAVQATNARIPFSTKPCRSRVLGAPNTFVSFRKPFRCPTLTYVQLSR